MTRTALVPLAALLAVGLGCHKTSNSSAIPGVGPPTVATPATTLDYRTFNKAQIEALILEKTGNPVTLTAAGANKYTGTRPSPDQTVMLQVTVTVEAERLIVETRGGAMSARDIITPRGLEVENVR